MKRLVRATVSAATIALVGVFTPIAADEMPERGEYSGPKEYLVTLDGAPWGMLRVTCDLQSPDCRVLPSHEFAASLGIEGDCGMVSVYELRDCIGVRVDANPDGYIVRLRTDHLQPGGGA